MAELGFLQLCSDRRYHRKTMLAFEDATGHYELFGEAGEVGVGVLASALRL